MSTPCALQEYVEGASAAWTEKKNGTERPRTSVGNKRYKAVASPIACMAWSMSCCNVMIELMPGLHHAYVQVTTVCAFVISWGCAAAAVVGIMVLDHYYGIGLLLWDWIMV